MRILFVMPYPPSRIRVRGYGFLTHLRRSHDVTVAVQCASEYERADAAALQEQGYEVVVVEEKKLRSAMRGALALPGADPLQAAYARSASFTRAVSDLYREGKYDVMHVEHMRGIASMESLARSYPLVWDAVDCISLLCKHTIAAGPNMAVRTVARVELKRTQRYEARLVDTLRHVVVTSERDRQALIELRRLRAGNGIASDETLGSGMHVIPNGVDLAYFSPMQEERRRYNIVFSGKMSYHANIVTALYLYRQIMPLIWQKQSEARLTIVGSKPPKVIQQLAQDRRVEVTGYVDDLRPYIARAEVVLSPMVYSVGIQNKVLEAMALGTPVIAARQAVSALGAQPGRDLLVAESASEFAEAALRVMDDAGLQTALSRGGREYVERHHDWQAVTDQLIAVYEQAIVDHRHGRKSVDREESPAPGIRV